MSPAPTPGRLRIAFVADRFGNRYGGAEAYGVELVRELSQRHEVTVIAREYDPACGLTLPFIRIKVPRRLPSWLRVLVFAVRTYRTTCRRFDIVHSHMNGYCGDVEVVHVTPVRYKWRVRPLSAVKRCLSWISPRVPTYLWLESARLRQRPGHSVVGVSKLIAEQLEQAYGNERSFPVIPPGVIRPNAEDATLRISTRARLNYADDDFVCLLLARNPLRKGLLTVLDALKVLPEKYKLLVVGANAAARDALYKNAEYFPLAERVIMMPETSEVAQYFLAADIYVHPTRNDSFGMAPLEAMSYGLPVILSPAPWCGFSQYLQSGEEALMLSSPDAYLELAAHIEAVADDDQFADLLRAGGARVVDRHSWAEVARQYESIYQQCLEEKRADIPHIAAGEAA